MTTPPRNAFATRVIHAGQSPDPSTGAIMPPIYATSTYVQESPGVHKGYEYSRSQNPTRFAWERCVADLESGTRGYAFASGLAATATVLDLFMPGDHIIASDDLYGGSYRLFERVRAKSAGLKFSFVDLRDHAAVEAAIRPETRMIWVETPTNPMLKLADLEARKGSQIAVLIGSAHPDHPDRRHEDRDVPALTPQLDGHIALFCPDQHPRHQAPVGEGGRIGALRQFVAGAARHVGPDRRRHRLFGPCLEFFEGHRQAGKHTAETLEVDLDLIVAIAHEANSRKSATTSAAARSCPRSELVGIRWISLVPTAAKPRRTSAS